MLILLNIMNYNLIILGQLYLLVRIPKITKLESFLVNPSHMSFVVYSCSY